MKFFYIPIYFFFLPLSFILLLELGRDCYYYPEKKNDLHNYFKVSATHLCLIVLFFYLQPTVFMNSWFVSVCDPSYFSSRLERNVLDLGIKLNKLAQGKYVWRLQIYGCIRNFLYYTCTNNMLKSYSRIFIKNWSIYYNDLNFKSKSNYKFWCSEMGDKLQIGEIIQIMIKI